MEEVVVVEQYIVEEVEMQVWEQLDKGMMEEHMVVIIILGGVVVEQEQLVLPLQVLNQGMEE